MLSKPHKNRHLGYAGTSQLRTVFLEQKADLDLAKCDHQTVETIEAQSIGVIIIINK
jgi:hypothetical protein